MIGKGEIDTPEKLAELDQQEIVAGYLAGMEDEHVPLSKSVSFYHGWLNAQVDRGRVRLSDAQRKLAHLLYSTNRSSTTTKP